MKKLFLILALLLPSFAQAQIIPTLPVTLTNGTLADANQVMSDFNTIVTGVNTNGAKNGANSDITALNALTTPITPAQGGSSVYTGNDLGAANAYVVSSTTPINYALRSGNTVNFIPLATSTGASTLSVGGTPAKAVLRQTAAGLQPLVGGEIFAGQIATAIYDGVQYELINSAVSSNVQPCTSIDYAGVTVPTGYLAENGQALLRASFAALNSCLNVTSVAATTTAANTSITVPNSALFQVGWYVGGTNVTCNSNITSITSSTTIVINNSAGANGATTLQIGPNPQGDCATTFNVPNYYGRATVMADSSGATLTSATCANPASIGSLCGAQTQTLTLAQLPTGITSSGTQTLTVTTVQKVINGPNQGSAVAGGSQVTAADAGSGGALGFVVSQGSNTINVTSNNTSGAAHPIVQPIALVTKAIKF